MTTIAVSAKNRDRLKARGKKGETFDQIVSKLLDDSESR